MRVLLSGSVAYDYLMTFPGKFVDHFIPEKLGEISLSFLVDSMVKRRGGTAPNIAYTLALLGEHPAVLATVGEDFGEYRQWLEQRGVNTQFIKQIPGVFTASFFANTDMDNNQIASFYPGAMAHAAEQSLHDLIDKPELVVISPDDPGAMNKFAEECVELNIPYLYDPGQQIVRLSSEEILKNIKNAKFIFLNQYEFGLVERKTGWNIEAVLEYVDVLVVTMGKDGAMIYTKGKQYPIPAVSPEAIIDPTGVGDAFRAGFLSGYFRGWDLDTCGRMGALASTYVLENNGPQDHYFTREMFVNRYRSNFDDAGLLDALIEDTI